MTKIKDLPKVDMPREKLEKYGPGKLTDSELLALLLGSGIKGLNVLQLSKKILKLIEKVGVEKITLEKLLEEKGLGKAIAEGTQNSYYKYLKVYIVYIVFSWRKKEVYGHDILETLNM